MTGTKRAKRCVLFALAAISLAAAPVLAVERPIVIDGDTLQVEGEMFDLAGIDAPELGQLCRKNDHTWPCGEHAAWALHKLVDVGDFACMPWTNGEERSPAGRDHLFCHQGDHDLAEIMIRDGYATANGGTFPTYLGAEDDARNASLGIWAGKFDRPSVWRAERDPAMTVSPCPIRGIRDEDGNPVFYVPTDPGYDRLRLAGKVVEKRFCSEEEAAREGWRHVGQR
ncbi:MAG: thermonuclease family protein [Alphaproteobacteria bacterium]